MIRKSILSAAFPAVLLLSLLTVKSNCPADTVSFVADTTETLPVDPFPFPSDDGVEVLAAAFTSQPNGGAPNENAPFPNGLSPVVDSLVRGTVGLGIFLGPGDTGSVDGGGLDEVLQLTFPFPVRILSVAFGVASGNDTFDLGVSPTTSFTDAVDIDVPADESFGSDNFDVIAGTPRGTPNAFFGVTLDFTPGVEITDGDPDGPAVPLVGRSFYFYTNQDSFPQDDYTIASIEFEAAGVDPNEVPEPLTVPLAIGAAGLLAPRRRRHA